METTHQKVFRPEGKQYSLIKGLNAILVVFNVDIMIAKIVFGRFRFNAYNNFNVLATKM